MLRLGGDRRNITFDDESRARDPSLEPLVVVRVAGNIRRNRRVGIVGDHGSRTPDPTRLDLLAKPCQGHRDGPDRG